MNVVMTATVRIVMGIVEESGLPSAVNARAPRNPVVRFMTVVRGLPHAGSSTTAGRLATREGRIVVPRNPFLAAKPVKIAVVTKGSGMKRMTDMKTVLPGTLTAMQATGKTNTRVP